MTRKRQQLHRQPNQHVGESFGDWSKMPRKVAAKPPRKALREAICLPVSATNSALTGCMAI
jgi:hypothetical protein